MRPPNIDRHGRSEIDAGLLGDDCSELRRIGRAPAPPGHEGHHQDAHATPTAGAAKYRRKGVLGIGSSGSPLIAQAS